MSEGLHGAAGVMTQILSFWVGDYHRGNEDNIDMKVGKFMWIIVVYRCCWNFKSRSVACRVEGRKQCWIDSRFCEILLATLIVNIFGSCLSGIKDDLI